MSFRPGTRVVVFCAFVWVACAGGLYASPEKYEGDIRAFEEADLREAPEKGGIVFTGSSTITRWNKRLAEDFPGHTVIGRGFGGSTVEDAVYYVRRTVLPYEPRMVVFYAGENDIANGHSPQRVADDFAEFCRIIHRELPDTRILYLVMKPSPTRWHLQPKFEEVKALIADYASRSFLVACLDMTPAMLDSSGMPRPELYESDRLHMNREGYAIWRETLEPLLEEEALVVPLVTGASDASPPELVPADSVPQRGIFVDFGAPAHMTTDIPGFAWNNLTRQNQQADGGLALVDVKGKPTGIALRAKVPFVNENQMGTYRVADSLARFPRTATGDSLFGHGRAWHGKERPLPELELSGLNPQQRYVFTFFASRMQSNAKLVTVYEMEGAERVSAALDAADNESVVVVSPPLAPSADGTLSIRLRPDETNDSESGFVYLNALEIENE